MRGKRTTGLAHLLETRLIPAHAGKTDPVAYEIAQRGAHPRACGENAGSGERVVIVFGSSPRMRGKRDSPAYRPVSQRLIPAHAGKTRRISAISLQDGAHPRACGENAERSGVLTLRSVRSWKTLSFPSSLKVTHCRTFVQLSLSSIRL